MKTTKNEIEIFKQFAYEYAQGYKDCFCADTGEKYPLTFTRNHFGRFLDYLEERHNIEVKSTNQKMYKIYEDIMLTEINKFIVEYKKTKNKKEKESIKKNGVKRKKD